MNEQPQFDEAAATEVSSVAEISLVSTDNILYCYVHWFFFILIAYIMLLFLMCHIDIIAVF